MELFSAKCPNCGANIDIDRYRTEFYCTFCGQKIILNAENSVSPFELKTDSTLVAEGDIYLELNEYIKAKNKYQEAVDKDPNNYLGWLGLLRARTQKFTIKDDNTIFMNDIEKYYNNLLRTAPPGFLEKNKEKIERFIYPEKFKSQERLARYAEIKAANRWAFERKLEKQRKRFKK